MERMWSYLRRFSRMTKEMRPAHRVEILTHALLYYGHSTKRKLPSLLSNRWKRTIDMCQMTKEAFKSLCDSVSVPITHTTIEEWTKIHQETMTSNLQQQTFASGWKSSYFVILQAYYVAREDLNRVVDKDISFKKQKVISLDRQLAEMERSYDVTSRWKPADQQYEEARTRLLTDKKNRVHTSLWSSVVKRHYLLRMKAKYADGQKIAKKLCSSIAKETKVARQLLEKYNAAAYELCSGDPLPSLQDVLSLDSDFWAYNSNTKSESSIAWKTKQEIIRTSLMLQRCEEEMEILQSDMLATVKYWFDRIKCISDKLQDLEFSPDSIYIKGMKCVLKRLKTDAELQHHRAKTMFSQFVELPSTVMTSTENVVGVDVDNIESDSESEDSDTESEESDKEPEYL